MLDSDNQEVIIIPKLQIQKGKSKNQSQLESYRKLIEESNNTIQALKLKEKQYLEAMNKKQQYSKSIQIEFVRLKKAKNLLEIKVAQDKKTLQKLNKTVELTEKNLKQELKLTKFNLSEELNKKIKQIKILNNCIQEKNSQFNDIQEQLKARQNIIKQKEEMIQKYKNDYKQLQKQLKSSNELNQIYSVKSEELKKKLLEDVDDLKNLYIQQKSLNDKLRDQFFQKQSQLKLNLKQKYNLQKQFAQKQLQFNLSISKIKSECQQKIIVNQRQISRCNNIIKDLKVATNELSNSALNLNMKLGQSLKSLQKSEKQIQINKDKIKNMKQVIETLSNNILTLITQKQLLDKKIRLLQQNNEQLKNSLLNKEKQMSLNLQKILVQGRVNLQSIQTQHSKNLNQINNCTSLQQLANLSIINPKITEELNNLLNLQLQYQNIINNLNEENIVLREKNKKKQKEVEEIQKSKINQIHKYECQVDNLDSFYKTLLEDKQQFIESYCQNIEKNLSDQISKKELFHYIYESIEDFIQKLKIKQKCYKSI